MFRGQCSKNCKVEFIHSSIFKVLIFFQYVYLTPHLRDGVSLIDISYHVNNKIHPQFFKYIK